MAQLNRLGKSVWILAFCMLLSVLITVAAMMFTPDANEALLRIKINPEFELYYDIDGNITKVNAVNDDAEEILSQMESVVGKKCTEVTKEIILAAAEAGYLESTLETPEINFSFESTHSGTFGWEADSSLVNEILIMMKECAESNNWQLVVTQTVNGEVAYSEGFDFDDPLKEEVSSPDISEESSEPEVSEEPEDNSGPTEASKAESVVAKPETSKPQTGSSASSKPVNGKCTHRKWEDVEKEFEQKYDCKFYFMGYYWDKFPSGPDNVWELDADCDTGGYLVYKCPNCAYPIVIEELEPLGHDFSGPNIIRSYPTLYKEGVYVKRCLNDYCSEQIDTDKIPKKTGSYDTIDSCFAINGSQYEIEELRISINDHRTWGSIPKITFDMEKEIGKLEYTDQNGVLQKYTIQALDYYMDQGYRYVGIIYEDGTYDASYRKLSFNGATG